MHKKRLVKKILQRPHKIRSLGLQPIQSHFWLPDNPRVVIHSYSSYFVHNTISGALSAVLLRKGYLKYKTQSLSEGPYNPVLSIYTFSNLYTLMRAKSLQSCPTLCNPMDGSPPGSSVHGFSRQEYWSGLPCPSPGDFPNPGIEPVSLRSPALAGGFFTTSATWEAQVPIYVHLKAPFLIKLTEIIVIRTNKVTIRVGSRTGILW